MKLLLAEDDPDMLKIIRLYLIKAGHTVETATDGEEALMALSKTSFDLLISDWMMPKMSGIELCESVRSMGLPIKIILLTAKSSTDSEIEGLKCGADDYIKKPFEPEILLLRVEKLLKTMEALTCGQLTMNLTCRTLLLAGQELELTQKEWSLMVCFMKHVGITLSRDQLMSWVWGIDYEGDERTLDTHIRRLRQKIGAAYIQTYVGFGYRLEVPYESLE